MIATIAEATTRLEQRVEERTRDLEHTNAQLREEMQARERMAVALRESEEKYRNVSERANDGILIAQNELIKYCNTRLAEMLGYTVEELQETRFDRLVDPAYRTLVLERVRQRIQGAAVPSRYEIVVLKRDGSTLDIEINAGLMEYGGNIAVLAFVRDMTERKQAEQSLQRSEELYRLLTENMHDVVWKMDPAGTFTYVSPSVYHLRGYTPQEVMEQPMSAALTPDSLAVVLARVARAQEIGRYTVECVELEQPCKNGSTVWTECVTTPLLDEQGTLTGWVGVSRDITERRRVAEELRQAKEAAESANRAKSAFLANMSHELRTPLNAILGFAQIMRSSHDLPCEHGDHVAIIYRNGEHLLSLINNVLDLSKIEAGRMMLNETHFDLCRMLDDLEDTFRLPAHEKRLALHFACTPDVPRYGYADEVKLRQVLLNLLSNAIKFTSNGSVVLRVSATRHPPDEPACVPAPDKPMACCTLRFEVADTGIGMAAEELDHLFHPFVQTHSGQQAHGGTGLGLAISRRFVEMMGGTISISSSVNVGSTFTVTIPVAVGASHGMAPPAEEHRRVVRLAPAMPRYRLLVVDDRSESRLLLTSLLHPLGFVLREACNGQEAIAVWQAWEPHLILMDMRMPVMDGDTATRHIKATTATGQAPIIVALTASAFEDERDAMLAAGCDDFLRKPFRAHELFTLLQRHLGLHYEYAPASDTAQNDPEPGSAVLTTALSTLPVSLVADLELAAVCADMVRVDSLIDQIASHHAPLAEWLRSLAHDFEYDQILTIIEESR
jgi:PAS domain S-box-containing protein